MEKPAWFRDGQVLVINARTCGINKDGVEQYQVDLSSGRRLEHIDDALADSVSKALREERAEHVSYILEQEIKSRNIGVPSYFDSKYAIDFEKFLSDNHKQFEGRTLGELQASGELYIRRGHGSPSLDQRVGDIPYIKVSDLRAGLVNVNPSNRVPRALAEKYWRGNHSGFEGYDIVCPERASKNIGEFCVLLPGQEEAVFTKEVIALRGRSPLLTQFYLMWAMSLVVVRRQWERVVFMQTNREDVGERFLEIRIPYPRSKGIANALGEPFSEYFGDLDRAKRALRQKLDAEKFKHHIFFA